MLRYFGEDERGLSQRLPVVDIEEVWKGLKEAMQRYEGPAEEPGWADLQLNHLCLENS